MPRSGGDAIRVVHVNDVAGVGSAAAQQARSQGLDWRLWPLPAVRGRPVPVKALWRGRDLRQFRPVGRAAAILHVHYGLFAYYAWSVRRPYVLHLHGTDVRENLSHRALGPLVVRGVRRAGAVVYSTPDLAAAVTGLRPDAIWLPAPLSPILCRPDTAVPGGRMLAARAPGRRTGRPIVVFASRWDPVKGLDALLGIAARLRGALPGVDLVGVDWGDGADRARAAGVRLVPLMARDGFHRLLAGADVVVGQQAGDLLTVSDLEAMALARPLVVRFTAAGAYGDVPEVWNTAELDAVEAVQRALDDPAAASRALASRRWALRHHDPQLFVDRCQDLYATVLGC